MAGRIEETGIAAEARALIRGILVALYGAAGFAHFAATDRFLLIVPSWVPEPRLVVQMTGMCEIAGAVALLVPKLRRAAGVMLALYALCVLPANVEHAIEGVGIPGLPDSWWYHGPRLGFQPVLIWFALYGSHVLDWPFHARSSRARMPLAPSPSDRCRAHDGRWRRRIVADLKSKL